MMTEGEFAEVFAQKIVSRVTAAKDAGEMVVALDAPPRPTNMEVRPKATAIKQQFTRAPKRREYHKEKSASLKRLLAK